MAVLSGKKGGASSGHDFDRVKDKNWGSGRGKINKSSDLFSSDYIYVYIMSGSDDDDNDDTDNEIGINKSYHKVHDMDWCNCEKNEYYSAYDKNARRIEDEIFEIINADGSIDLESLQNLLFGEDE